MADKSVSGGARQGGPATARIRVVHVITRLIVGGAQENTIASVLGLRRQPGLEVDLISGPTAGPEGSLESEVAGLPGFTLLPSLIRPIHPWHDVKALLQLARLLLERVPRIVHTHSGKAGFLARVAARRARVPVIVHTIHGPSFGPFQSALANIPLTAAERVAGRLTTHFVCVADAMRDRYLAAGIGRPDQYSRIFSGFPLAPFLNAASDGARRQRLGLAADDLVIAKVARLFRLKGHDELLEAAPHILRRCPRARFLLVGDGPWRERLQAKATALGVAPRFLFVGLVPPSQIPDLLAEADLVVHLSRREGLPRVLPQAQAAGKPAVSYDCDGAAEVCRDGQTGFLVRPGDLPALVNRVLQLADNAELRHRLGAQGRSFVQREFPVEKMVDDLHALYLRLVRATAENAACSPTAPSDRA